MEYLGFIKYNQCKQLNDLHKVPSASKKDNLAKLFFGSVQI